MSLTTILANLPPLQIPCQIDDLQKTWGLVREHNWIWLVDARDDALSCFELVRIKSSSLGSGNDPDFDAECAEIFKTLSQLSAGDAQDIKNNINTLPAGVREAPEVFASAYEFFQNPEAELLGALPSTTLVTAVSQVHTYTYPSYSNGNSANLAKSLLTIFQILTSMNGGSGGLGSVPTNALGYVIKTTLLPAATQKGKAKKSKSITYITVQCGNSLDKGGSLEQYRQISRDGNLEIYVRQQEIDFNLTFTSKKIWAITMD